MANRKITFSEFWERYPLHKAKKPAERAWNKLSAKDQLAAYNGVDRYRKYCERTGIAVKYPQGWLNDRRWEDEDEEPGNLTPGPSPNTDEMEIW